MSARIRPLERDDVPQVAALYEHVARSGSRRPAPGLAAHFENTFLDHPWADPEVPSLVHEGADGRVEGFLGSHVRRMRLGERTIRLGCSGHLVTEPEARNRAVGAFLMRAYMSGEQDLTFTDTASETVRRMWHLLGGETSQMRCVGWVRVLRPGHFAAELVTRRRAGRRPSRAAEPIWSALDAAGALARSAVAPRTPLTTTEPLTPSAVVERLPAVAHSFRLRPAYEDGDFVTWLFDALAAVGSRGRLVARLVRGRDARVLGWYVLYVRPGRLAQVLQVAAPERGAGEVLDQLFHDAAAEGACGVQGRVEPHLFTALSQRHCLFHRSGFLALIHARDPALLHAVQSGGALLTRMEGEWWMGHHSESFADDRVLVAA